MKVHLINKLLLLFEMVPLIILIFLSLALLVDTRWVFFSVLLLAILSMISLFYIMVMTVLDKSTYIEDKFIYLAHLGVFITVVGLLSIEIDSDFKTHSSNVPYAIFSFGLVACIPYLHVMIVNKFFIKPESK